LQQLISNVFAGFTSFRMQKGILSSASQLPLLALKIKPNSASPTNAQQVSQIKIQQSHLVGYHLIYHFTKNNPKT